MYLIKHMQRDIANVVMELTRLNYAPTGNSMKEMKRLIKYVIDTGNKELEITPQKNKNITNIVAYSDSDFAGNTYYRISVSGFSIHLNNAPIIWRYKEYRSATLSSSEAEYVVLSEASKKVKFIWTLLKSTCLEVKLQITVIVDNAGAIFMSEKVTTSSRTKYMDTR